MQTVNVYRHAHFYYSIPLEWDRGLELLSVLAPAHAPADQNKKVNKKATLFFLLVFKDSSTNDYENFFRAEINCAAVYFSPFHGCL